MATSAVGESKAKRSAAERFDLDAALRKLGQSLIERDGLPGSQAANRLRSEGLIGASEHSFLICLAAAHLTRHTPVEVRPDDPPPCPNRKGACRSAGLARAIIRGCDALRDRKELKHVSELRAVVAETDRTLAKLTTALDEYIASNEILHERRWRGIPEAAQRAGSKVRVHVHANVCGIPSRVRERAMSLRRCLAVMEERSLASQFASAAVAANRPGRKWRPLLLAEMQADMVRGGWHLAEVAKIVDDGIGGEPVVVRDRIRKRVAPYLDDQPRAFPARPSPSPSPIEAERR